MASLRGNMRPAQALIVDRRKAVQTGAIVGPEQNGARLENTGNLTRSRAEYRARQFTRERACSRQDRAGARSLQTTLRSAQNTARRLPRGLRNQKMRKSSDISADTV